MMIQNKDMSEFLKYTLDCETDFSPLFNMKKGDKDSIQFLIKLSDWLTHNYEPYHLQMNIVDSLKILNYKVAIEDLDLVVFWLTGIEYLIKNCADSKFRRSHPNETTNFEYMEYAANYIKKHLQKAINKCNKKKTNNNSQNKVQKKLPKPKNGFKINVEVHL